MRQPHSHRHDAPAPVTDTPRPGPHAPPFGDRETARPSPRESVGPVLRAPCPPVRAANGFDQASPGWRDDGAVLLHQNLRWLADTVNATEGRPILSARPLGPGACFGVELDGFPNLSPPMQAYVEREANRLFAAAMGRTLPRAALLRCADR